MNICDHDTEPEPAVQTTLNAIFKSQNLPLLPRITMIPTISPQFWPCLEALECQRGVGDVRGDDRHEVHSGLAEKRRCPRVGLDSGEVLASGFEALFVQVTDGGGNHARPLHLTQMVAAHIERRPIATHCYFLCHTMILPASSASEHFRY